MEYRPKVAQVVVESEELVQEEAKKEEAAPVQEKKPKRKNNKKEKETKENKDSNLPLGVHQSSDLMKTQFTQQMEEMRQRHNELSHELYNIHQQLGASQVENQNLNEQL